MFCAARGGRDVSLVHPRTGCLPLRDPRARAAFSGRTSEKLCPSPKPLPVAVAGEQPPPRGEAAVAHPRVSSRSQRELPVQTALEKCGTDEVSDAAVSILRRKRCCLRKEILQTSLLLPFRRDFGEVCPVALEKHLCFLNCRLLGTRVEHQVACGTETGCGVIKI